MANNKSNSAAIWHSFQYDLYHATASLMYLLQGMQSVRASELVPYNITPTYPGQGVYPACSPNLPYIDVSLFMQGIGFDLNDVLRREGEAEQLAFKGWVEQVYFLWEHKYRNTLKKAFDGPNVIRLEGNAIGDFRHIRNDLIHNKGVATPEETGKCKTLKWFEPGESIILGMRHVLDLLNQMAFMTDTPGFLHDGPSANWSVGFKTEEELANGPVPNLISLRTEFIKQLEDGSSWHMACVVFENGIFANIPIEYPDDKKSIKERNNIFDRDTVINQDGNLSLPHGNIKDRKILYKEALAVHFGRGTKNDGLGIPGPAYRFRK